MKKLAIILTVAGLLLTVTGTAEAITIVFNPNDIVDLNPPDSTGVKVSQPNARKVHERWINGYYGTFSDAMESGHTQPNDYNTYMNWRDGLTGDTEGIAIVQGWFMDNPSARSWGETTVLKPGGTVTATATDGWNFRIIQNPYGLPGAVVQWYTTDPAKRIRVGGADLGEFSITVDLYHDDDGTPGYSEDDTPVEIGEEIRMWLGALNDDDAPYYLEDTQAVYFDASWGTSYASGVSPFAAVMGEGGWGSGFEAAVTGMAVPEPGTMVLLAIGGIGVLIRRRRRRVCS